MKAILAINSGSSSVKFAVYEARGSAPFLRFKGSLDRLADAPGFNITDSDGHSLQAKDATLPRQESDLAASLFEIIDPLLGSHELVAIGHRIVHGGPDYSAPTLLDTSTIQKLEELAPLAPLHQLAGLDLARRVLSQRPHLPNVACFDTAFHHDLPAIYRRLPLPKHFENNGLRRYGFHGLSFEYIVQKINRPELRMVIAHLGSGCSICAVANGKSVNTTMSLTPLDGVVMATRTGSIDPGVLLYLQRADGLSITEVEELLYHKSGLFGLSGLSADIRVLLAATDQSSKDAVNQFCARTAEQIAVMATAMNGVDALIFTGGIGANSAKVRNNICDRLKWIGVARPDGTANFDLPTEGGIRVQAMTTEEEMIIASHTLALTSI